MNSFTIFIAIIIALIHIKCVYNYKPRLVGKMNNLFNNIRLPGKNNFNYFTLYNLICNLMI